MKRSIGVLSGSTGPEHAIGVLEGIQGSLRGSLGLYLTLEEL